MASSTSLLASPLAIRVPFRKSAPDVTLRYLTPDEYSAWDAMVEASPQGSIFCRTWWLEATCAEIKVLGYFEKGRLVAGIPLHFERRVGFRMCTMPKLTQTWGVVIEPLAGKPVHVLSREMEILDKLAAYLINEKIFVQSFHPSLQNWLPFYWQGFEQTTLFTYVLDNLTHFDRLWMGMAENTRREIRKAQKKGVVVGTCDCHAVFEAVTKTFDRQSIKRPYSREYFMKLWSAATKNGAGECFAAGSEGEVHAAAFLVWDHKRSYYLAGGGDPGLRNSGATSLLLWHLIQVSAERSCSFDFEGSVKRPIERFFRSFGAKQVPYSQITRLPMWAKVALGFRRTR